MLCGLNLSTKKYFFSIFNFMMPFLILVSLLIIKPDNAKSYNDSDNTIIDPSLSTEFSFTFNCSDEDASVLNKIKNVKKLISKQKEICRSSNDEFSCLTRVNTDIDSIFYSMLSQIEYIYNIYKEYYRLIEQESRVDQEILTKMLKEIYFLKYIKYYMDYDDAFKAIYLELSNPIRKIIDIDYPQQTSLETAHQQNSTQKNKRNFFDDLWNMLENFHLNIPDFSNKCRLEKQNMANISPSEQDPHQDQSPHLSWAGKCLYNNDVFMKSIMEQRADKTKSIYGISLPSIEPCGRVTGIWKVVDLLPQQHNDNSTDRNNSHAKIQVIENTLTLKINSRSKSRPISNKDLIKIIEEADRRIANKDVRPNDKL